MKSEKLALRRFATSFAKAPAATVAQTENLNDRAAETDRVCSLAQQAALFPGNDPQPARQHADRRRICLRRQFR